MALVRLNKDGSTHGDCLVTKLRDFLRISDAADYLGVSPNTLRNWERTGKIAAHRHPVNGYRLFRQQELDSLLRKVEPAPKKRPKR
jgi:excisionase family DNA binding protein